MRNVVAPATVAAGRKLARVPGVARVFRDPWPQPASVLRSRRRVELWYGRVRSSTLARRVLLQYVVQRREHVQVQACGVELGDSAIRNRPCVVNVLYEQNLVPPLVINQFVSNRANDDEAETSGAKTLLGAYGEMCNRVLPVGSV